MHASSDAHGKQYPCVDLAGGCRGGLVTTAFRGACRCTLDHEQLTWRDSHAGAHRRAGPRQRGDAPRNKSRGPAPGE